MTVTAQERARGPEIWLGMDQAELDEAYDQRVWAPNMDQLAARRAALCEEVLEHIGSPLRFSYGPTPIEGIDVFLTKRAQAPVNVFVHGGAWRASTARDYAFLAETFVDAGAHLAIVDFNNVTETAGALLPLARQVRNAVGWLYKNARAEFGGNSDRLYLTGHSSGSHLGGSLMVTDWRKDDLPKDILKGGVLCSGMYDLKPVRLSKRSSYVEISDEIEAELSAIRHLDRLNAPITVIYGSLETPEFQRQSRVFADAAQKIGKQVRLIRAEHYNHFELLETFANPFGVAGRAALAQMHLVRNS